MPWTGKRKVAIVTACMNADETPALVMNEVLATESEVENGIHFYWAEAELLEAGYEEPWIHFDEFESPPFLHPALRRHLASAEHNHHPVERAKCPA